MYPEFSKHACPVGLAALFSLLLSSCGSGQEAEVDVALSDNALVADDEVIANGGPEGDSSLSLAGVRYPLDTAVGNVLGEQGNHFLVSIVLADGNFAIDSVNVDGQELAVLVPGQGTALIQADVYSLGASFSYSTYAFVDSQDSNADNTAPGVGYFTNASVGIDSNQDGMVAEDERLGVIDGVVDFSGSRPSDITMNFALTLEDGESVSGQYTGLFDFTIRFNE